MKKAWGRWVWLAVGAVVIVLIFYNLSRSPEWRNFRWDRLWRSIVGARPDYLLLSVLLVYSTFVVRAIRWRFFMAPIKAASLWVLFVGQVLGFSSIFLVGRPGELVRPAYIAKKENVPMSGDDRGVVARARARHHRHGGALRRRHLLRTGEPGHRQRSLRPARDARGRARALRIYRPADSGFGAFPPEGRGHDRRRAETVSLSSRTRPALFRPFPALLRRGPERDSRLERAGRQRGDDHRPVGD